MERVIICRDCEYQAKPPGGRENDPESFCMQEERMNYVTGEISYYRCFIKNPHGKCTVFYQRIEDIKTGCQCEESLWMNTRGYTMQ